jgi:hypothetical protein
MRDMSDRRRYRLAWLCLVGACLIGTCSPVAVARAHVKAPILTLTAAHSPTTKGGHGVDGINATVLCKQQACHSKTMHELDVFAMRAGSSCAGTASAEFKTIGYRSRVWSELIEMETTTVPFTSIFTLQVPDARPGRYILCGYLAYRKHEELRATIEVTLTASDA